jgi:hypothetical protein
MTAEEADRSCSSRPGIRGTETPYAFVSLSKLHDDFKVDVEEVSGKKL